MNEFRIIPAIDLLDGNVVRLYRGDYNQVTVYSDDPVPTVKEFVHAGASLIHVVDLNAARDGNRKPNASAIESILTEVGNNASVEIGGGIRSEEDMKDYFDRGVDRCILGTSAVTDPDLLKRAVGLYGHERIIVGVDAKDGTVRISGWEKDGGLRVSEFLNNLEGMGVKEIIFTDIKTDGTLSGPPIDSLREILATTNLRVIASGGVSSLADVESLLSIKNDRLVGAIAGRAVYENKLKVEDAVQLIRKHMMND